MPIEIRPFSAEWLNAVREFNGRLDTAGAAPGMRLPEDPQTEMLPGSETWLALEGGAVRGGYTLRPQQFSFRGEIRRVAHYRLPVSEGLIDRSYAMVGSLLLFIEPAEVRRGWQRVRARRLRALPDTART